MLDLGEVAPATKNKKQKKKTLKKGAGQTVLTDSFLTGGGRTQESGKRKETMTSPGAEAAEMKDKRSRTSSRNELGPDASSFEVFDEQLLNQV